MILYANDEEITTTLFDSCCTQTKGGVFTIDFYIDPGVTLLEQICLLHNIGINRLRYSIPVIRTNRHVDGSSKLIFFDSGKKIIVQKIFLTLEEHFHLLCKVPATRII